MRMHSDKYEDGKGSKWKCVSGCRCAAVDGPRAAAMVESEWLVNFGSLLEKVPWSSNGCIQSGVTFSDFLYSFGPSTIANHPVYFC